MRVLIISDTFCPAKDGVVRFITELSEALYEVHEVTLMVPRFPKRYYPPCDDSKFTFKIVRIPVIPVQLHSYFWTIPTMSVFREIYKADVVIFNSFAPLGFYSIIIASILRKRKILFVHHNEMELLHHAFDIPKFLKTNLGHMAVMVHKQMDHFVYATNKFKVKVRKLAGDHVGMSKVPFVVEPRSALPDHVAYLREKFDIPEGKKVVLYLGRFSGEKNVEIITEVMCKLSKREDVVTLMGGNGYLLDEMKLRATSHNCSVRFLGMVPEEYLWDLYSISDVLLTPTPHEVLSFTVIEGLAMGVIPVVNGRYHEEIVNERNAVLINNVTDVAEIYTKTSEILDNPDNLERMRQSVVLDLPSRERFKEIWLCVLNSII